MIFRTVHVTGGRSYLEISNPVHGCAEFVAKWGEGDLLVHEATKATLDTKVADEAIRALCALGHKRREAERLVSQSIGNTVQEIIANVYKTR